MNVDESLVQSTWVAEAAAWPFFAVATLIFFIRSVARIWYIDMPFGWEDYLISVSWVCDLVRMITFQLALSYTRAVRLDDLPTTVPTATFWALFTDSWSFISVTLPKVGVAFLLVRVFRPSPWMRTTILSMAIGLFLFCFPGLFISMLLCSPAAGQWNPYRHPGATCLSRNSQMTYALVGSSLSAVLDFAFAAYPGFVIWHLKMSKWKKISTSGLMCLGFAAFAIALVKVSNNRSLMGEHTILQVFHKAIKIGFWNSVENDLVLIAACLPSCPAAFKAGKRAITNTLSFSTLKSDQSEVEKQSVSTASTELRAGKQDGNIYVRHDVWLGHEDDKVGSTAKLAQSRAGMNWV